MEAEKLDKKSRDALPTEHFAVPGKRKLPINDERHVRMGWDMVDRTHGLTPEERSAARAHILRRAKELGIDTKDWHKLKAAMHIQAMALNISNSDDHPNKMPFEGVLVKLDEISSEAPNGTSGRKIIVTSEAAEAALASLLGMAVDFTPAFDGHDPQSKVGIITSANVVGNEIQIAGFIYAADFPEVAASIKALKTVLGFSFEAQRICVLDPGADVLTITEMAFTGAAILRKDKAAYQSTSLAASAAEGILSMTPDEIKELFASQLAEALKPLQEKLNASETANGDLKKALDEQGKILQANQAVMSRVEPHASAMESCAAAMDAAGVGGHPEYGHVAVMRRMAGSMRADAAVGKVPHIFRDHDYPYNASAVPSNSTNVQAAADVEKMVAKAVEAAVKPLNDQLAAANEKLAAADTKISDLKASKRLDSPAPERKTLTPAISAILAKANLAAEGDGKFDRGKLNEALKGLGLTPEKRIETKIALERRDLIAN